MSTNKSSHIAGSIQIETLHSYHSRIRAADWRSPLVARLTDEQPYVDGSTSVSTSYRPKTGAIDNGTTVLEWSDLKDDYGLCLNTYQAPVITEFAALALACVLCEHKAKIEITEVTRRGEKVDYWLGDRELLLEVSGALEANLDELCDSKAVDQLQKNPFEKDGFVCASRFATPEARLWFYSFPKPKKSKRAKKATR